MKLSNLLKLHHILNVTADSNNVNCDSAFVAIRGSKFDGNDFIEQVINEGARIIFTENESIIDKYNNILPVIYTENARKLLAEISAVLTPNIPNNLIAVTGTNGKSSIVHYVAQFLAFTGNKAGTIGTLGVNLYEEKGHCLLKNSGLTTSGPVEFHEQLSLLKKERVEYCVVEASSIGLDQYRLYGRKFKVAGFSSFSRDHLDYHGSMEKYLDAKLLLFSDYMEDGAFSVINSDITEYSQISTYLNSVGRKYISVGSDGGFGINIISKSLSGYEFTLSCDNKSYNLRANILGEFQIYNIILSLAMLTSIGFEIDRLIPCVEKLTAPIGRLERVDTKGIGSSIFVDYAHTTDALSNVLRELKYLSLQRCGKLIIVFGCGGNRDKGKRRLMGEVAINNADFVVVTDDNPRDEDAAKIRKDVIEGAIGAQEISDRKKAIEYAINSMEKSDILLIAGKGHEDYQIIGEAKYYFSDKVVAKEICDIKSFSYLKS